METRNRRIKSETFDALRDVVDRLVRFFQQNLSILRRYFLE